MPRPLTPLCGHDALWLCEICGRCAEHCCLCKPPGTIVSTNSKAAAETLRRLRPRPMPDKAS